MAGKSKINGLTMASRQALAEVVGQTLTSAMTAQTIPTRASTRQGRKAKERARAKARGSGAKAKESEESMTSGRPQMKVRHRMRGKKMKEAVFGMRKMTPTARGPWKMMRYV